MGREVQSKAVGSFIMGICGWLLPLLIPKKLPVTTIGIISYIGIIVFSITSIILGVKARKLIRTNEDKLKDKAKVFNILALIGLTLGIVAFILIMSALLILGILAISR